MADEPDTSFVGPSFLCLERESPSNSTNYPQDVCVWCFCYRFNFWKFTPKMCWCFWFQFTPKMCLVFLLSLLFLEVASLQDPPNHGLVPTKHPPNPPRHVPSLRFGCPLSPSRSLRGWQRCCGRRRATRRATTRTRPWRIPTAWWKTSARTDGRLTQASESARRGPPTIGALSLPTFLIGRVLPTFDGWQGNHPFKTLKPTENGCL